MNLVDRLRKPAWCYDEGGQDFSYIDAETAGEAATMLERLIKENGMLREIIGRALDSGQCGCIGLQWIKDAKLAIGR